MASSKPSYPESEPRVLHFRRPGTPGGRRTHLPSSSPVEDLAKYERSEGGEDDYRHRMLTNVAAFLFVLILMGIGLWIADTMAAMRRNQDCVLSGRSGCTPVEVEHRRW